MTRVTLVTQPDCRLCEHAKTVLARIATDHPLQVDEVALNSASGQQLATRIGMLFAPGILLDGEPFGFGRVSERKLRKTLVRRAT